MESDSIKVSVTVPIYNSSKYLRKCLDSLQAQKFSEIEFILIDDGSTDNCGEICDEYAQRDSRFIVIHKKNGGSASARQAGLDVARGEYIIVCDSDDWVEPNMYERLFEEACRTDADIVMCQFAFEYPGGESRTHINLFKNLDGDDFIKEMMSSSINNSSWDKLIRRELFAKNNISYEPGINLGEDGLILYKLLKVSPKVTQIPDVLYHYRREFGGNSYTNSLRMQHIKQLDYTRDWINTNYSKSKFNEILYKKNINFVFACLRAEDLDLIFFKQFIKKNLKWRDFCKFKPTLKSCIVYSCKFTPYEIIKYILKNLYPFFYK